MQRSITSQSAMIGTAYASVARVTLREVSEKKQNSRPERCGYDSERAAQVENEFCLSLTH